MSPTNLSPWIAGFFGCLVLAIAGCRGDTGPQGPVGIAPTPTPVTPPPIVTTLDPDQDLPGTVIEIKGVSGGSGANGNFQPGDMLSVTYTVEMKDGTAIPIDELDFGGILVSGPTSNFQRVLEYQSDLRAESRLNADGSYTYTFATSMPTTYLAPLNDTPSFGAADGELTGLPLLAGTYTVGLEAYKSYTVAGESFRDAGNATFNFLVGSASLIENREVVTVGNCNQCHVELRVHGTIRRDVTHCLLCHTTGAEDRNDPNVAGGTPGVSIDFKVMIHRIHNGAHLPSVLGVTTDIDGNRVYDATPQPYTVVGRSAHDYSHIGFPIWPNLTNPLPADDGYSTLTPTQRGLENSIRSGAATCAKCHGDPDGAGPAAAPAQGQNAYSKPTRAACGSCHDDIDWTRRYKANQLIMPPQPDDATCARCHPASAALLGTMESHRHPILNPAVNSGLVFNVTKVSPLVDKNSNDKLDAGEIVSVDFTIRDDSSNTVEPSRITRMEVVVAGPTVNRQILLEEAFPTAALTSSAMTTTLPERVFLQYVQDSTAGVDVFKTGRRHWNLSGGATTVQVVNGPKLAMGSLAEAVAPYQNYVDLATTTSILRGDYIVIDRSQPGEEYLRVQFVDGNRLWFSSTHSPYSQPGLRNAHLANAPVEKVALVTMTAVTDYTLNAQTGEITEVTEFGAGNPVLVSYTTDFVMPEKYGLALNASPDQDESWGKWTGLALLDGTYSVAIWGETSLSVEVGNDTTTYSGASRAVTADFLVGTATTLEPVTTISSAQNCYSCHDDVWFHGSHRRGLDSCLICHGTAGGEDRPQYVAPNAPATTAGSIEFRHMLHKIHMGKDLANASTYIVNGFGSGYPNNYTAHSYEEVGFPSMVGGVKSCATCHGTGNDVWKSPPLRNHPAQVRDTRSWSVACSSCHDTNTARAHIDAQTSSQGAEACATCHGIGKKWGSDLMHKTR